MKQRTRQTLLVLLGTLGLLVSNCGNSDPTVILPSMDLDPGSEREVAYTDKQAAFWVTRSGGYNSSPWHGLTVSKRAYLEDLFIYADGHLLPRSAAQITVNSEHLIRNYPDMGIREVWTLLDHNQGLLVQLEADRKMDWAVQPAILGGSQGKDFEFTVNDQRMNIYFKRLTEQPFSYSYLNIWFSESPHWNQSRPPELPLYTAYLTQRADHMVSRNLTIRVNLSHERNLPKFMTANIESLLKERHDRQIARLSSSRFESNHHELDRAVSWAQASIDALVMRQLGAGIYAGLPWFDDYWGRDTFISFTGAVLISGQFAEARQILQSFAELQNTDIDDPNYGRVPNRARPDDIIYNTADGTPWFVRSVWDYFRYSGDEGFLEEMWPVIQRATEGALKNWVDNEGLLRHADADTWMDARGPDGPWSPRGDRAVEIQFIWRDQLEITSRLAEKFHDTQWVERAQETLSRLADGLEQFRSGSRNVLVDHLNADGSRDQQIRPNLFLVPPLFQETCDWSSFKTLAPQLICRKGVLSLSQNDADFHPYHQLSGLYVKDAAYHNGVIWTWNSAAIITQAIHFHQYQYAKTLFDELTDQILHRGAVGAIAELSDAWPREGKHQLSGTFSQAWSVAEYLRSFYQDILGVQPYLSESMVRIAPRIPKDLEHAEFLVPLGRDLWEMEYTDTESIFNIRIHRKFNDQIKLKLALRRDARVAHLDFAWSGQVINLRYEKQMGQWTVPSDIQEYFSYGEAIDIPIDSLPFCPLDTLRIIPVLEGPEHRLLHESEVVVLQPISNPIIRMSDQRGDDRGEQGTYTYPSNPQFEAGIVDILEINIGADSADYIFEMHFADLVDPGWHPEYGYQLTYTALGISYMTGTGTPDIGKNALTIFRDDFKADQILYVSGGILLVDDEHQSQVEYLPVSSNGAIGNVDQQLVRFKLPRAVFEGDLSKADLQLAVGFQDDHGGAGLGDFRSVGNTSSEWLGGGKNNLEQSNIYDWLTESHNH